MNNANAKKTCLGMNKRALRFLTRTSAGSVFLWAGDGFILRHRFHDGVKALRAVSCSLAERLSNDGIVLEAREFILPTKTLAGAQGMESKNA